MGQQQFERPVEQPPTIKPIVVKAEATDAVSLREESLLSEVFLKAQIIEPESLGKLWLIVANKPRQCLRDIGPLRKPFAPPQIVFRDWMELWKIVRNETNREMRR